MKDEDRLKTTPKTKLNFSNNGWCSLTISNVSPENVGTYICSVRNKLGADCTQV
ncbi:MAG: hypothetical protein GY816_02730 [Cytophagales bacterium]|nr:hypothetical protein [Cytophagales bacterium]